MVMRSLSASEVTALLDSDCLARLASLDEDGYPHVTPLWFHWDGQVLRMTSLPGKPHVDRLSRNPRAGVVIDVEDDERSDGQRPNRQVRFVGDVEVVDDVDGEWTRTITARYLAGPGAGERVDKRSRQRRVVIVLRPTETVAVSSV